MKLMLRLTTYVVGLDLFDDDRPYATGEQNEIVREKCQWVTLERLVRADSMPAHEDDILHLRDSFVTVGREGDWRIVGDELVRELHLDSRQDLDGYPEIWEDEYRALLADGWKEVPRQPGDEPILLTAKGRKLAGGAV